MLITPNRPFKECVDQTNELIFFPIQTIEAERLAFRFMVRNIFRLKTTDVVAQICQLIQIDTNRFWKQFIYKMNVFN